VSNHSPPVPQNSDGIKEFLGGGTVVPAQLIDVIDYAMVQAKLTGESTRLAGKAGLPEKKEELWNLPAVFMLDT
jgi:hypothetical protein